jgi:AcrR family transcriptional regulator
MSSPSRIRRPADSGNNVTVPKTTVGSAGAAPGKRPLRLDAAQNRERLLAAASRVFAEHGLDVSVEEIAREAGVGMGTLYRRFPTKQALIDELVGQIRRAMLTHAQEAAQKTDGSGLEALLLAAGQLQAEHPAGVQQLWGRSDAEQVSVREFRRVLKELLRSAQDSGRIRPDVKSGDIQLMMWSLAAVIVATRASAPTAWRRHLDLLIAGLRPVADGPFARQLEGRPLSEAHMSRLAQEAARPTRADTARPRSGKESGAVSKLRKPGQAPDAND